MTQPALVGQCMAAIAAGAPNTPVTVKCRLGVDDLDSYEQLCTFIRTVSEAAPVRHFIMHARIAYLDGLNPHENRTVPPLRHEWVFGLKRDFPHLEFTLNGGVVGIESAAAVLQHRVDGVGELNGVMVGRGAWNDPWGMLANADVVVFGERENAAKSRRQVLWAYAAYADGVQGRFGASRGGDTFPNLRTLTNPLLNMFHGQRGGKKWKQAVDEALRRKSVATVSQLLAETLGLVPDEVLDAPPGSGAAGPDALPVVYSLPRPLPVVGDRAGLESRVGKAPRFKKGLPAAEVAAASKAKLAAAAVSGMPVEALEAAVRAAAEPIESAADIEQLAVAVSAQQPNGGGAHPAVAVGS